MVEEMFAREDTMDGETRVMKIFSYDNRDNEFVRSEPDEICKANTPATGSKTLQLRLLRSNEKLNV
jgi:hypothetical protein